ncbi:MAG: N-acetylmuramoyl-L-alanine amidase [Chitinophagaceae bacterium]|nr:N-acetylmuramoyl-L-alanine amidase [Chitinophagaceae bacterium]
MLTFAYYVLKVIICSGILYGYYLLTLRNKMFHKWNRFYLLAAMLLSLIAPLIKINIWQKADQPQTQAIQFLQVVSANDEMVYHYTKSNDFTFNSTQVSVLIYITISFILFCLLIISLFKINRLAHKYPHTNMDGISFINTDATSTPFSFFNIIFWNDKIDMNTPTGKQILRHEIAHVEEKHSHDKIFMNLILICFWSNPIFWLIKRELNMIHEFIADKMALENSDTSAFAAMILQATYPRQQFNITNNFFYSPLKRRLLMLTKNKNANINYVSRLLVLPLATLVFFAFTLKMKTISKQYTGKKITVVIDAGHGGDDIGAFANNLKEKDLSLAIAREIKMLNKNENINIILSRDADNLITPKDRVKFATENKADLFISIHINAVMGNTPESGLNIFIPGDDNTYTNESRILAMDMFNSFKDHYPFEFHEIQQREKGIWIIDHNSCPAILIQPGFITSKSDAAYLGKTANQQIIAQNILNGIEKYTTATNTNSDNTKTTTQALKESGDGKNDTIPKMYYKNKKVINLEVVESTSKINVTYNDGTKETITREEANKRGFVLPPPPPANDVLANKLLIVDGKTVSSIELKAIAPVNIKIINVLNDKMAFIKYGKEGKNGAIELITKNGVGIPDLHLKQIKDDTKKTDTNVVIKLKEINKPVEDNDKIFTKTEIEPSFPGGQQAWIKYITQQIQDHLKELNIDGKSGTCNLRFIVNAAGEVSDIVALSMQNTILSKIAIDAVKNGLKWNPAKQNGHIVNAFKELPVTFVIQND